MNMNLLNHGTVFNTKETFIGFFSSEAESTNMNQGQQGAFLNSHSIHIGE